MVRSRAELNKWPYYICGRKIRVGPDSCKGRTINATKADQAVLDVVLRRILTPQFVTLLIEEMRAQFANTAQLDRREQELQLAITSVEKSIGKLLNAIEETDSPRRKIG